MDRNLQHRDAYIAIAFALIFVAILCTASFVIARPFLAPLLWGVIVAIATWPAFARGSADDRAAGACPARAARASRRGMSENVAALGSRLRTAI